MNLAQLFGQATRAGANDTLLGNLNMSRSGEGPLLPGQGQLQFNPTQNTMTNAPVFDWNNNAAGSRAAAQMGGAMGAGWQRTGVNAFLPGDLNYFDLGGENWKATQSGETDVTNPDQPRYRESIVQGLEGLAKKLGYDTSGYDLSAGYQPQHDQHTIDQYKALGINLDPGKKTLTNLYEDLNKDLSKFQRNRSASAGWDGSGNMRSTSETMYYEQEPGKWVPISSPKGGQKREHRGWAREEGADTLAAASVIMPAFGGWAGLLGQGTAGTLSAGSGLGLTSGLGGMIGNGLANTVVNSVMNGIMSGGNPQSILSGLGSGILGQGAMGLAGGKSLGDIFGGNLPSSTGQFTGINDFLKSGTGQAFLRSAPMRTESGQGLNQLFQAGSRLANSLGA